MTNNGWVTQVIDPLTNHLSFQYSGTVTSHGGEAVDQYVFNITIEGRDENGDNFIDADELLKFSTSETHDLVVIEGMDLAAPSFSALLLEYDPETYDLLLGSGLSLFDVPTQGYVNVFIDNERDKVLFDFDGSEGRIYYEEAGGVVMEYGENRTIYWELYESINEF